MTVKNSIGILAFLTVFLLSLGNVQAASWNPFPKCSECTPGVLGIGCVGCCNDKCSVGETQCVLGQENKAVTCGDYDTILNWDKCYEFPPLGDPNYYINCPFGCTIDPNTNVNTCLTQDPCPGTPGSGCKVGVDSECGLTSSGKAATFICKNVIKSSNGQLSACTGYDYSDSSSSTIICDYGCENGHCMTSSNIDCSKCTDTQTKCDSSGTFIIPCISKSHDGCYDWAADPTDWEACTYGCFDGGNKATGSQGAICLDKQGNEECGTYGQTRCNPNDNNYLQYRWTSPTPGTLTECYDWTTNYGSHVQQAPNEWNQLLGQKCVFGCSNDRCNDKPTDPTIDPNKCISNKVRCFDDGSYSQYCKDDGTGKGTGTWSTLEKCASGICINGCLPVGSTKYTIPISTIPFTLSNIRASTTDGRYFYDTMTALNLTVDTSSVAAGSLTSSYDNTTCFGICNNPKGVTDNIWLTATKYGRYYMKFNIANLGLPAGSMIQAATLGMTKGTSIGCCGRYDTTISACNISDCNGWGVGVRTSWTNASAYNILNQTWSTSGSYSSQPCGANFDNAANCNLTAESTIILTGQSGYYNDTIWPGCHEQPPVQWNIKNMLKKAIDASNSNLSIVVKTPELKNDPYDQCDIPLSNPTITFGYYYNYTIQNGSASAIAKIDMNGTYISSCIIPNVTIQTGITTNNGYYYVVRNGNSLEYVDENCRYLGVLPLDNTVTPGGYISSTTSTFLVQNTSGISVFTMGGIKLFSDCLKDDTFQSCYYNKKDFVAYNNHIYVLAYDNSTQPIKWRVEIYAASDGFYQNFIELSPPASYDTNDPTSGAVAITAYNNNLYVTWERILKSYPVVFTERLIQVVFLNNICNNKCQPGESKCSGSRVDSCVQGVDGCYDFYSNVATSAAVTNQYTYDCAPYAKCKETANNNGVHFASCDADTNCTSVCQPNQFTCSEDRKYRIACIYGVCYQGTSLVQVDIPVTAYGYLWATEKDRALSTDYYMPCGTNQMCSGGQCVYAVSECNLGETQCQNITAENSFTPHSYVVPCTNLTANFRVWGAYANRTEDCYSFGCNNTFNPDTNFRFGNCMNPGLVQSMGANLQRQTHEFQSWWEILWPDAVSQFFVTMVMIAAVMGILTWKGSWQLGLGGAMVILLGSLAIGWLGTALLFALLIIVAVVVLPRLLWRRGEG